MIWSEYFEYKAGVLYNLKSRGNVKKGDPVKCLSGKGYVRTNINKKGYVVHRIVWEMFNGPIPNSKQIDHINRNKQDNRIENLRLVNNQENSFNRKKHKNKRQKYKGVSKTSSGKFRAQASINGKKIGCKVRNTAKEAAKDYDNLVKSFGIKTVYLNFKDK